MHRRDVPAFQDLQRDGVKRRHEASQRALTALHAAAR